MARRDICFYDVLDDKILNHEETAPKIMEQKEDFRQRLSENAEKLVSEFFPRKIIEFEQMLLKDDFNLGNIYKLKESTDKSLQNIHPAPESGETPSSKADFDCNGYIIGLVEQIKPEIIGLLEAVNTVKVWITLQIPKIEDGNNFGVEVQEETLGELKSVEQDLLSNQEEIAGYFLSRAKVVVQLLKKPGVKDYTRFVEEEDEKQFVSLRLMVAELRNCCSSIYDLISKNIDKIKSPRSSNAMSSIY